MQKHHKFMISRKYKYYSARIMTSIKSARFKECNTVFFLIIFFGLLGIFLQKFSQLILSQAVFSPCNPRVRKHPDFSSSLRSAVLRRRRGFWAGRASARIACDQPGSDGMCVVTCRRPTVAWPATTACCGWRFAFGRASVKSSSHAGEQTAASNSLASEQIQRLTCRWAVQRVSHVHETTTVFKQLGS